MCHFTQVVSDLHERISTLQYAGRIISINVLIIVTCIYMKVNGWQDGGPSI